MRAAVITGIGAGLLVVGVVLYLVAPSACYWPVASGALDRPYSPPPPPTCYPDPAVASWAIPLWAAGIGSLVIAYRVQERRSRSLRSW